MFQQGFEGDGIICQPAVPCSENPNVCDENAECLPVERRHPHNPSRLQIRNEQNSEFVCKCGNGFHGDGYLCESKNLSDLLTIIEVILIIKEL